MRFFYSVSIKQGFTLIEILVVLVIVSLLFGLAVPGLVDAWQRQHLYAQAQGIAQTFLFARSEAILQQKIMNICAANLKQNLQIQGCQSGKKIDSAWDEGILVYTDHPNGTLAAYDSEERQHLFIFKANTVRTEANQLQWRIDSTGHLIEEGNPVFLLSASQGKQCLTLIINRNGRSKQHEIQPCFPR